MFMKWKSVSARETIAGSIWNTQRPTYTQLTILLNWELDNFIRILPHYQQLVCQLPPFHRPCSPFFIPFALAAAISFMQKQFSEYIPLNNGFVGNDMKTESVRRTQIGNNVSFVIRQPGCWASPDQFVNQSTVSQSVWVLQCFNVIMTIWSLELDMTFAISIPTPSLMN